MKKIFAKVIAIISVLAIVACSLFINMVWVSGEQTAPQEYPKMTVEKIQVKIDYLSDSPSADKTAVAFDKALDFTNECYDFFEMDFYVSGEENTQTVKLALFDSQGGVGVTEFDIDSEIWSHLKFSHEDFAGNLNFKDILGIRIENPVAGVSYKAINICITGITQPAQIALGSIKSLVHRIDVTDTNKSSSYSQVFSFDNDTEINIYSKDWIEFDLFVSAEAEGQLTAGITFVDNEYNSNSKTNNQSYSKVNIEVGKWQHFKLPARSFKTYTNKTCNMERIVGVCLSSMKNDYRYVLANLCLSTATVTAPEPFVGAEIIKSGIFTEYYSITENSTSDKSTLTEALDLTSKDHIRFDMYIDSYKEDMQGVTVNFEDDLGNVASYDALVKPCGWVQIKIPKWALKGENVNLQSIGKIYLSKLEINNRYFAANLCLTESEANITDGYPEESLKLEGVAIDYINRIGDAADASKVNFNEINISDYDQMQFDLFVDIPLDSSEIFTELKLALVDDQNREYTASLSYKANQNQNDIKCIIAATGSVDFSKIKSVYIKNPQSNYHYIIKNICFLKITPPILEENVDVSTVLTPNPIVKYQDFKVNGTYNSPIKFDNDAVINTLNADYIELDTYVVLEEGREDYVDTLNFTLYLCDATYCGKNYGRAAATVTVEVNKWQHLKIPVTSFSTSYGWNGNKEAMVSFMVETSKIKGLRYIVSNMVYTIDKNYRDYNGVFPNNTTDFKVDYALDCSVSVGLWGTYTEINPTIDVTDVDYVKFDIYCFSEKGIADRIEFSLGNCKKGEWKARARYLFTVKMNEWVTVKIKYEDFDKLTLSQGLDMTKASMYTVASADSIAERIVIRKLCTVKRLSTVEKDEGEKSAQPDKNSRYISNCEAITSDIGVWTSGSAYFTSDYKTEAQKSVASKIEKTDNAALSSIRFLFYSSADFTKTDSVKFDMFIDDEGLAAKSNFEIILSGDKRCETKNHRYTIKQTLKNGWNTIVAPISEFVGDSNADLSSVILFSLYAKPNDFGEDDYFILGIDNLRAASSFVLSSDDAEDIEDMVIDSDSEEKKIITVYEDPDTILLDPEETTTHTTQQIIKKKAVIIKQTPVYHWIIMIISCILAAGVIAASAIIIIKKR